MTSYLPTPKQIAVLSAALSTYLEAEIQVALAEPVHPWGLAARHEMVGSALGVSAPHELPIPRRRA